MTCGHSYRVFRALELDSIQIVRVPDEADRAHAGISFCPNCAPGRGGVAFVRPAPTRQRLREALRALIAEARVRGDRDLDTLDALEKEFGLAGNAKRMPLGLKPDDLVKLRELALEYATLVEPRISAGATVYRFDDVIEAFEVGWANAIVNAARADGAK